MVVSELGTCPRIRRLTKVFAWLSGVLCVVVAAFLGVWGQGAYRIQTVIYAAVGVQWLTLAFGQACAWYSLVVSYACLIVAGICLVFIAPSFGREIILAYFLPTMLVVCIAPLCLLLSDGPSRWKKRDMSPQDAHERLVR